MAERSGQSQETHTTSVQFDTKELKNIKIRIEIKHNNTNTAAVSQQLVRELDNPEALIIHTSGGGLRPIFQREGVVVNKYVVTSEHLTNPARVPSESGEPEPGRQVSRSATPRLSPRRQSPRTHGNTRSYTNSRRSRHGVRSRSRSPLIRRSRSSSGRRRRPSGYRRYMRRSPTPRSRSPRYRRSPYRRRSRSRSILWPRIDPSLLGRVQLILPPNLNFYGMVEGGTTTVAAEVTRPRGNRNPNPNRRSRVSFRNRMTRQTTPLDWSERMRQHRQQGDSVS